MNDDLSARSTIAKHLSLQEEIKAALLVIEDPLARELRKVGEWRESLQQPEPKVIDVRSMAHIGDMGREVRRRNAATEQAEQRTVAALEALLQEAQTSKTDNARMLWWARAAAIAGITAAILTMVPMVQTYFAK